MMPGGLPRHLVGSHVPHGLTVVQFILEKRRLSLTWWTRALGDAKAFHRRRGLLAVALGGRLRRSVGFAIRDRFRLWRRGFRCRRCLLGAGPPCARGETETLDLRLGG